jgi:hypothetical protein
MPDAPRNKLYVDPSLPAWLPDLTVRDLRLGKHKLDIRFWIEDGETAFEVIKGDPALVERCDLGSKGVQLRTASDPIRAPKRTKSPPSALVEKSDPES